MPANHFVVIDPFAGSCNTLFWILRHLPNSQGIAFESDQQVFALTHRNLAAIGQTIDSSRPITVRVEFGSVVSGRETGLRSPHRRSLLKRDDNGRIVK
jgi:hypothetical protein